MYVSRLSTVAAARPPSFPRKAAGDVHLAPSGETAPPAFIPRGGAVSCHCEPRKVAREPPCPRATHHSPGLTGMAWVPPVSRFPPLPGDTAGRASGRVCSRDVRTTPCSLPDNTIAELPIPVFSICGLGIVCTGGPTTHGPTGWQDCCARELTGRCHVGGISCGRRPVARPSHKTLGRGNNPWAALPLPGGAAFARARTTPANVCHGLITRSAATSRSSGAVLRPRCL